MHSFCRHHADVDIVYSVHSNISANLKRLIREYEYECDEHEIESETIIVN